MENDFAHEKTAGVGAPAALKSPTTEDDNFEADNTDTGPDPQEKIVDSGDRPAAPRSAPKAESWTRAFDELWRSATPISPEVAEFYADEFDGLILPDACRETTKHIIRFGTPKQDKVVEQKDGKLSVLFPVRDGATHAVTGLYCKTFWRDRSPRGGWHVSDYNHHYRDTPEVVLGPRKGYIRVADGALGARTMIVVWGPHNAKAMQKLFPDGANPTVVSFIGYHGSSELEVPEHIETVIIGVNVGRDSANVRAAKLLADRLSKGGKKVILFEPISGPALTEEGAREFLAPGELNVSPREPRDVFRSCDKEGRPPEEGVDCTIRTIEPGAGAFTPQERQAAKERAARLAKAARKGEAIFHDTATIERVLNVTVTKSRTFRLCPPGRKADDLLVNLNPEAPNGFTTYNFARVGSEHNHPDDIAFVCEMLGVVNGAAGPELSAEEAERRVAEDALAAQERDILARVTAASYEELFKRATPAGDLATAYFKGRGLEPPPGYREAHHKVDKLSGALLPSYRPRLTHLCYALTKLTKLDRSTFIPNGQHTILVDQKPDGAVVNFKNASGYSVRTTPGVCDGGFFPVREGSVDADTLVVGEGVESVAAALAFNIPELAGVDFWALTLLNAGNFAKLPIIEGVRRVYIVMDNDRLTKDGQPGPGVVAAYDLANRLTAAGIEVILIIPRKDSPDQQVDANDVLLAAQADHRAAEEGVDFDLTRLAPGETWELRGPEDIIGCGDGAGGGDGNGSAADAAPEPKRKKPTISLAPGRLSETIREIEQALVDADLGLYQRVGEIVIAGVVKVADEYGGEVVASKGICTISDHALLMRMSDAANYTLPDARAKSKCKPADPSLTHVKSVRAMEPMPYPVLNVQVSTPLVTVDGRIISEPGYDAQAKVLYDPEGVEFPPVPEFPTLEDAKKALEVVWKPFQSYKFVDDVSKSVALSTMMSAVVRATMPTCPAHAASAPLAGSGKSKLAESASALVTGRRPPSLNPGKTSEELEKRLFARMRTGTPFIAIDNCSAPVEGDFLTMALTSHTITNRVLSESRDETLKNIYFVTINGNNLILVGDMNRRVLICIIDPRVERPELEVFDFDPVEYVMEHRAEMVVAILTILRAYALAKAQGTAAPIKERLQSFDAWSDSVRSAIVWLGWADPVASQETMREEDPVLSYLRPFMACWEALFGTGEYTVAEAVAIIEGDAEEELDSLLSDEDRRARAGVRSEFRKLLMEKFRSGPKIDTGAVGYYMRSRKNRTVGGKRFVDTGKAHRGVKRWRLEPVEGADTAAAPAKEKTGPSPNLKFNGAGHTAPRSTGPGKIDLDSSPF